jgi:hypothetical protein
VKQRAALLDNGITEWCYSESEGAVYVPGGTLHHACSRPKLPKCGLSCPEAMRLYPWGDEPPFCEIQFDADDCLRKIPGWRPDPLGFRPGSASAYGAMEATGTPPQWMADGINGKVPPTDGSPWSGDCHPNESGDDVLRVLRGHVGHATNAGALFGAIEDPRATVGAIICCRDLPQAFEGPAP